MNLFKDLKMPFFKFQLFRDLNNSKSVSITLQSPELS